MSSNSNSTFPPISKPGDTRFVFRLDIGAMPMMERVRVVRVVDLARSVFDVALERSCGRIERRLVLPSFQLAPSVTLGDLRAAWAASLDPTRLAPD